MVRSRLSARHSELAGIIRSTSAILRATHLRDKDAWKNHVQRKDDLEKYASAMKELSEEHWSKWKDLPQRKFAAHTRISEVHSVILNYFKEDIVKQLEFDIKWRDRFAFRERTPQRVVFDEELYKPWYGERRLKLMDIGSCYDPFRRFEEFETTAIDLCPATDTVHQADFLEVPIVEKPTQGAFSLVKSSFDAAICSYVMPYLPCSEMRLELCRRVHQLLKPNGLFVIVSPGEKSKATNRLVRALSLLGFAKYQVLNVYTTYDLVSARKHQYEYWPGLVLKERLMQKESKKLLDLHVKKLGGSLESWKEMRADIVSKPLEFSEADLVDLFRTRTEMVIDSRLELKKLMKWFEENKTA